MDTAHCSDIYCSPRHPLLPAHQHHVAHAPTKTKPPTLFRCKPGTLSILQQTWTKIFRPATWADGCQKQIQMQRPPRLLLQSKQTHPA
eukprot:scaffold70101_cov16-Tisochrysis_lutea.AAC.2